MAYRDDPTYYSGHGHWVKSADYESQHHWSDRITKESLAAEEEGLACDLRDAPGWSPF